MLCRVCTLQIQLRQHALEHAIYVAPIPQRQLDHTDQGISALKELARSVGIDVLKELPRVVGIDHYLTDV